MSAPRHPLSCKDLLLVPIVLWVAGAVSVLLLSSLGVFLAGEPWGRAFIPWLFPLACVLSLAGIGGQAWLGAQLEDRRLFPRVFSAQERLGETDSGVSLLQLRLTLQVLGWGVSELLAVLGFFLALAGGDRRFALGFGGIALVTLLSSFPRMEKSRAQLSRWEAAVSTKSFGSARGCDECSRD